MIRKTIISALIFYLAYNLFLALGKPEPGPGQHQWQKNIILKQNYADNHLNDQVLIVGTSLTARIYNYMLPNGYYNLALGGGSIYQGLELIKQSPKKPKYILIESNLFYNDFKPENESEVFDPVMMKLRKNIPSFREENQPANIMTSLVNAIQKTSKQKYESTDPASRQLLLNEKMQEYNKPLNMDTVDHNLDLLKSYVNYFQAAGVKIIFYETPIHCELLNTVRYKTGRAKILAAFPPSSYVWLPHPDCSAYTYADGHHMVFSSAYDYSKWFLSQLKNLKETGE
jgi:hypothetical protein